MQQNIRRIHYDKTYRWSGGAAFPGGTDLTLKETIPWLTTRDLVFIVRISHKHPTNHV